MKRYAVFLVLTLLAATTAALEPQDKLCPDPLFGGANLDEWQGDDILFLLGLNREQAQQIEYIKADHEEARASNLLRLDELTRQLDSLSPDSSDFDEIITAIAGERAELVGEQVRQRIRMVAAIQAVLSAEQRIRLEQKMAERLRQQELAGDNHALR